MKIRSFTAKSAMLTDLTFNPISETLYAYSRTNEILVRPPVNRNVSFEWKRGNTADLSHDDNNLLLTHM